MSGRDGIERASRAARCRTDYSAAQIAESPGGHHAETTTATPSATDKPTGKSEPAGELVDINSASPEELDKLPGVGPARAKAIIAGRPYNGKDDLTNRKIIPANVYNGIKDKIVARQK